ASLSRHAYGLAFDIYGVRTAGGKTYMVASSYQRGLGMGKTCEGRAKSRGARLLRQLACDLDRSGYFRNILTPDSDRDHRDHFHISVYKRGERRYKKNRTTLLEPFNYGRRWVRRLPKKRYPSKWSRWRVVKRRYRLNRRLIRRRLQQKRRRESKRKRKKR
ncbi:extensin family protein, partial [Myxococcota bacterium]|nr:extensin family protein [Myxococcota bacterium]MBU1537612.1 extensin family protein [Myxococcota bacterium]